MLDAMLAAIDFPPNDPHRPGYRLDFDSSFAGPELDRRQWLPYYLPQWSSRALSAARYALPGDRLQLRIEEDQPPWCPQFDGDVRLLPADRLLCRARRQPHRPAPF